MKSTFIALALAYTVFGADPTPSAWSYQGTLGPAYWHRLSKEFEVCAKGTTQSPINLKTSYTAKQPPTYAFKDAKAVPFTKDGHSLSADLASTNSSLTHKGMTYFVKQFHLHTPSEHHVNGRHFDMELHIVTKSSTGKLLVNAIFFDVAAKSHSFLQGWKIPKKNALKLDHVKLARLVKAIKGFNEHYTYQGSLTTPPCTEGVTWIVSKRVLPISYSLFAAIKKAIGFNARPTQPAAKGNTAAPKAPVNTTPKAPDNNTAPKAPVDVAAPKAPVDTAFPIVPVNTAPKAPVDAAPKAPVNTAPIVPVNTPAQNQQ